MLEIMKKEIQVTIQYNEDSSNNEVKGERCISQGIEAEKESSHVPSLSPSTLLPLKALGHGEERPQVK